ncbi:MAG TPA: AtpZ/AtpI family protein [Gemmatimonadaceae bacterium]|jgi:ATP synthase protein I|nr:AtpZ/AtpI family protein [Gemmatimonadaceae bacterium]
MTERPTPNSTSKTPSADTPKEISAANFAGIGIQFALGIVIFLFLGKWIDSRLGSSPAGVIAGVFIGAAAGFYLLIKKVSAAQKADDKLHNRRSI